MSTVSQRKESPSKRATSEGEQDLSVAFEVALAMTGFTASFKRWAGQLGADAAPSYPRMRLLYALHCEGPQRMGDLADALDVTPRSVTALVDGLEAEHLVARRAHPSDRRATIIELTDEAREAVEASLEHQTAIAALFGSLSPRDQRELLRIVSELDARMRGTSPKAARPG